MNYQPIIDKLNKHFVYRSDASKFGVNEYWLGFKLFDDDLRYWEGDCDDYSLYLYHNIEGCTLWHCTFAGSGHMVCELPDGKWIDNNVKKPVNELNQKRYTKFVKYTPQYIEKRLTADEKLDVIVAPIGEYGLWNAIKNIPSALIKALISIPKELFGIFKDLYNRVK